MKHTTNKTPYRPAVRGFLTDGLLAVLAGFAIGLTALVNTARYGAVFPMMAADYLRHPAVILLNVLPAVLVSLALWLLLNRLWLSTLLTAAVFLVASFGNYFKIFFRGDPFVAADLSILREVGDISGRYPIAPTKWMIAEIVAWIVVCAALLLREIRRRKARATAPEANGSATAAPGAKDATVPEAANAKAPKTVSRGALLAVRACLLALVVLVSVYEVFPLYNDERMYAVTDLADEATYLEHYNPTDQYLSHGFVFSFLRSAYRTIERPVDGYSEDLARSILGRYPDAAIPADKRVDVIGFMLEAFADFSVYDAVSLSEENDVYGVWHRISEEGVSGRLVTNVFAAGTINSERNFLSGFDTTNSDYYSDASTIVRYFASQGYTTTGGHPGESWFYNRENINRWLGFDSYSFRQNRYGSFAAEGILPDAVFLDDVWTQYEARDKSKPYFSFNVTFQNHAPYSDEGSPDTPMVDPAVFAGLPDGTACYHILNNYLTGIFQTNQAIGTFVDRAEASDDPLILVFFGDHKPWLGGGNRVYEALGINLDLGTEEGMMNYYSTSYVIWANSAAKRVLGAGLSEEERSARFSGDGGDSAPCFLMTKLFDLAGWTGPALIQLERDFIREEAVAVNRETEFYVLADGTVAKDPGEEVLAREREILYSQYYLKHKNIYAK